MKRKGLLIWASVLVLAVGLLVASCGSSGGGLYGNPATTTKATGGATTTAGPTAAGAQVVMKNIAFDPASVTIKVGETVTWTNEDSVSHTVVGDNGEFQSDTLANGDTFSFTFDQAGTYTYHCSIHPSMKGTVTVQ